MIDNIENIYDPNVLTKIGDFFRHKRQEKGDKLKNVSSALGTSHAVISRIENGRYKLSVEFLVKMANYYGLTPEELFNELSSA